MNADDTKKRKKNEYKVCLKNFVFGKHVYSQFDNNNNN